MILIWIAMKDHDRAEVSHFFSESLRRYGYDPRSLGWIEGTQETRFRVLAAIGDLEGSSVLDVGCGFGDLYEYLCRNGISVDYTGVDMNPDFVEIARERHPDARFIVADFEEAKIDGRFDWAFESGVFNYKVSDHQAFVGNMVRKMFKAVRKGIAIDFLNNRGSFFSAGLYHPDPADLYHFCSKLSKRVVLRCDYKPTEFCVYLYRDTREAPGNVYRDYQETSGRRKQP
ncbi:MAG: class I SAM-dependent methyltransferase [Methanocella sp.]